MLVQSEAGLPLGNIPLTKNLGNALKDLQDTDAIQRKVFWIDQICINQDDIHERGRQVAIMGEIYTSATQVITYLGPEKPGDAEAIALMMIIDAHFERQYLRCLDTNLQFRRGISKLQKMISYSFTGVKDHRQILIPAPQHRDLLCLLPPPRVDSNDPGWGGFYDLASDNWPTRVWMMQENLLNRNTIMRRGTAVLEWDLVPSTTAIISYLPQLDIDLMWRSRRLIDQDAARTLLRLLSIRLYGTSLTRLELLVMVSNGVACSDPRDRIFALLGLVPGSEKLGIFPDYSKSVEDVFTEAAGKFITRSRSLRLLAYAASSSHSPLLPSWVPNWSSSTWQKCAPLDDSDWNASRGIHPCITIEERVLLINGKVIDFIPSAFPSTNTIVEGSTPDFRELFLSEEIIKSTTVPEDLSDTRRDQTLWAVCDSRIRLAARTLRIRRQLEDLRRLIASRGMQMDAVDTTLHRTLAADSWFPREDFSAALGFRAV
jgi:hypothetical protein